MEKSTRHTPLNTPSTIHVKLRDPDNDEVTLEEVHLLFKAHVFKYEKIQKFPDYIKVTCTYTINLSNLEEKLGDLYEHLNIYKLNNELNETENELLHNLVTKFKIKTSVAKGSKSTKPYQKS